MYVFYEIQHNSPELHVCKFGIDKYAYNGGSWSNIFFYLWITQIWRLLHITTESSRKRRVSVPDEQQLLMMPWGAWDLQRVSAFWRQIHLSDLLTTMLLLDLVSMGMRPGSTGQVVALLWWHMTYSVMLLSVSHELPFTNSAEWQGKCCDFENPCTGMNFAHIEGRSEAVSRERG